MNWDHMQGWQSGGGWMVFGMGLFWVLVIIGIVLLVRYVAQQPKGDGPQLPHETPMDTLKKRYASGEISKEDFERIKKDLAA